MLAGGMRRPPEVLRLRTSARGRPTSPIKLFTLLGACVYIYPHYFHGILTGLCVVRVATGRLTNGSSVLLGRAQPSLANESPPSSLETTTVLFINHRPAVVPIPQQHQPPPPRLNIHHPASTITTNPTIPIPAAPTPPSPPPTSHLGRNH